MPSGVYDRSNWTPWNKNKKCPQLSGGNNPRWNSVRKVCPICEKEFFIKKSHAGSRTTCGRKCHGKYRSKFLVGKKSSRWKGGISNEYKYNKEFTKELREEVKERDKNKCVTCLLKSIDNKKGLIVHHINFKKTDNRKKNLITLCRSCHSTIHRLREWKTTR